MINDLKDSIWNNKYVCRLAILDHAREIEKINEKIVWEKNTANSSLPKEELKHLESHFQKECADLWLILSSFLDCGGVHETEQLLHVSDFILNRQKRFAEKAKV